MPETETSILKLRKYGSLTDLRTAMNEVRSATGKSSLRQTFEIIRIMLGRQRLTITEYYEFGLWRPQLSNDEKAAFLSETGSTKLNMALSPPGLEGLYGLTFNKFLTGLALRAAGFPMQSPRALFGVGVSIPQSERLETAEDIAAWLRRDGSLPTFGKPFRASLCIGVASYLALAEKGKSVKLGDGRTVDIDILASEIVRNFSDGYLFEPLLRQHPDVEAITGAAVGALRVVTIKEPDGIRVLYVCQRLPAVGAMHDGATLGAAFSEALIDGETGRFLRVQDTNMMPSEELRASHVTGMPFAAVVLPFVREAQEVAIDAHRLLVGPGLLGFDIALTKEGPIINEVNSNPYHSIYQRSADRGLLNPDMKPRIEAALSLARPGKG